MHELLPRQFGYRFPAEREQHDATWLTFPWNDDSFPGKMKEIIPSYMEFIKQISLGEKVRINANNQKLNDSILNLLQQYEISLSQVEIFIHPSNDVWCRDHGPSFLINKHSEHKKVIVNWGFNAWGNKYPCDNDNQIPQRIAEHFNYKTFNPGIIMEGGSVDFNGKGTLITTEACLLNKNRNPHLTKGQIEQYLIDYYCIENVLWLNDGIAGDDTDGHVDDITRFVNSDTVITAIETNKKDENYEPLKENFKRLSKMRLESGKQINIAELPMPSAVICEDTRLPASYANFYITNNTVIVPIFRCNNDEKALNIISNLFPDRKTVGIDSTDIVWGFGSFHCLSQQEPAT